MKWLPSGKKVILAARYTQENCGNKTHSRCEAFYVWIVWQGATCYEILMSRTIYFLLRASGRCLSERSVSGPALTPGNRVSTIGHVLVSPLLFQICRNQWLEPIIKHTSKAAPHLSFRPELTTLRTALYLFRSMSDDWQLWQTHADDITNRDPGFCKHAINRRFYVCLYVNITLLILFEPVLPYRWWEVRGDLHTWPKRPLFLYFQCIPNLPLWIFITVCL